jgi:hypothetical protein
MSVLTAPHPDTSTLDMMWLCGARRSR